MSLRLDKVVACLFHAVPVAPLLTSIQGQSGVVLRLDLNVVGHFLPIPHDIHILESIADGVVLHQFIEKRDRFPQSGGVGDGLTHFRANFRSDHFDSVSQILGSGFVHRQGFTTGGNFKFTDIEEHVHTQPEQFIGLSVIRMGDRVGNHTLNGPGSSAGGILSDSPTGALG